MVSQNIEFQPNLHFSGFWHVPQPSRELWTADTTTIDFIGVLYRDSKNLWVFKYRHRRFDLDDQYVDELWNEIHIHNTPTGEEEGRDMGNFFAQAQATANRQNINFVELNCPGDQVVTKLREQPWFVCCANH